MAIVMEMAGMPIDQWIPKCGKFRDGMRMVGVARVMQRHMSKEMIEGAVWGYHNCCWLSSRA